MTQFLIKKHYEILNDMYGDMFSKPKKLRLIVSEKGVIKGGHIIPGYVKVEGAVIKTMKENGYITITPQNAEITEAGINALVDYRTRFKLDGK